jgi:hypothetical protein
MAVVKGQLFYQLNLILVVHGLLFHHLYHLLRFLWANSPVCVDASVVQ